MKNHQPFRQVIQYRARVLAEADLHGVTKTARLYGIHRDTIYDWRREIAPQKPGPSGEVSWQTDEETEALILQVKLATSHGPKRLLHELAGFGVIVGEKATRGVLERADLVTHRRKKAKKEGQPYYAPYPGYRLQVDTKAVPRGGDKRSTDIYQFTAIDIASKVRFLDTYDSLSNSNSIAFARDALAFFEGLGIHIECVQTDNHSTFTNLYLGGNGKADHELRRVHPLTQFLLSQGIEHKLSRPGTPEHNGFVERSHRTDEEDFYIHTPTPTMDPDDLRSAIKDWQDEYNTQRLHSSCSYLPPMEYYLEARKEVGVGVGVGVGVL
jgi:transposase InsO family protein